jgi:hypothetical protein
MSSNPKWDELCAEYIAANDVEKASWSVIQAKYHAIANGISSDNPTDQELEAHTRARQALASVREKMDIFMKKFLRQR